MKTNNYIKDKKNQNNHFRENVKDPYITIRNIVVNLLIFRLFFSPKLTEANSVFIEKTIREK